MKRISASAVKKIKVSTDRLEATYLLRRVLNSTRDSKTKEEIEYITQFLVQHTDIVNEAWWEILGYKERRTLVAQVEFYKLEKDQRVELILDRQLCHEAYIIIRGKGNAAVVPTDEDASREPEEDVLLDEGSVFGRIVIPSVLTDLLEDVVGWRTVLKKPKKRVKRVVLGSYSEYIVLRTRVVEKSLTDRALLMATQKTVRALGLDMLMPFVRSASIAPGTVLIQKGDTRDRLYIIEKGECRAFIDEKELATCLSSDTAIDASLLNSKKRIAVASLGPQSAVGDISVLFSILEPFSVEAVTNVEVHSFSLRDFTRGMKGSSDRLQGLIVNAYKRLELFVYRVYTFMALHRTVHAPQIEKYYDGLLNQLRPILGIGTAPSISLDQIGRVSQEESKRRQADRERKEQIRRIQLLSGGGRRSSCSKEGLVEEPDRRLGILPTSGMLAHAMMSLHSPMKSSLAKYRLNERISHRSAAAESVAIENKDDAYFFPTMTRNRKYHGTNLPQLRACRGFESPHQTNSEALQHYVFTGKSMQLVGSNRKGSKSTFVLDIVKSRNHPQS